MNAPLDRFFSWLTHASLEASVVVLLVLGAQFLFKRRLPARWRYALWFLVVLRLIAPALPHSPFSLQRFSQAIPPVGNHQPVETVPTLSPSLPTHVATEIVPERTEPKSPSPLSRRGNGNYALLWLMGALGFAGINLVKTGRFTLALRHAPSCQDAQVLEIARASAEELGLRQRSRVVTTPLVSVPAMVGIFRPTLLLPERLTEVFSPDELRIVFLHEFAHLRRGDMILNALLVVLQILHWFNPVLWFAFSRMRHDRELATDSLVLSGERASLKTLYGHTLLKLIEGFDSSLVSPRLVGIMENPKDIKDRLVRITQATPGAYRRSLLGLTLFTLIGATALTQGMADPTLPATAAKSSADEGNTITYRADTPRTVWNGWGLASPPNPNPAPAPTPEQFELVENTGKEPRTFSGKVVGLESMQGVEVGLVSLVGVHWVNKDAYQWEPVAADGSFSITDARYQDAGKSLVLRGPNTAWTFFRYDFDSKTSGRNIVLRPAPSKKVRITASGVDMENLVKVGIEPFYAHTQLNDKGAALRRQRLGNYNSQDEKFVDVVLPLGEVALLVGSPGWASFYQIIDTQKADHFHFVLKQAGQLKITVLDADGKPKPGVHVDWVNPAAPLSISNGSTKENGVMQAGNLVPGTFQVSVSGLGSLRVEIEGGSVTEVLLQEGKEPVISRSDTQPVSVVPSSDATNRPVATQKEDQLDGAAIFDRVKKKYSSCKTFACTGTSLQTRNTLMAKHDDRSFLIKFSRPGHIRVDWSESQFMGLGKVTSSIYTENGKVFSYSAILGGPNPYPSIHEAIGVEAGVSGGITYLIPPLLLGESGYLDHWTITRGQDSSIGGVDCYSVSLETKGFGIYTFDITKADFSILRASEDADAAVLNAQRERARKENPAWFNDPPGTGSPRISSKTMIQFQDLKFDEPIKEEEFRFTKP